MGRFLDEGTLTTLTEQTQVDFHVNDTLQGKFDSREREALSRLSHNTYELEEVSADSLLAYGLLPDLQGNPALLVTANVPRTITARGIVATRFAILSILAAAAILLIAIYWQMQRLVLSRLTRISQRANEIERSGNLSIRVPQAGRDELGRLGENLNNMLARTQSSKRALRAANVELEAQKHQLMAQQLELTAMNEELQEARTVADQANRTKSEFLANMSHEIRTPMTAILGFADVLVDDGQLEGAATEMVEAVGTIRRNGEYLVQIINDILDLSKIEADRMTVERIDCSPLEIIGEVISLVGVRAGKKGLPLDVEYIGAVPESIRTDPTRLRQVLINLIGNAIKFTENGSVRLIVQLVHRDNEPVMQFDVVDTGIGMTEEQVSRLFQPFTQADGSMTRKFGGTGLGLTISRRLTRLLGGDTAVVETQPGIGTRFRANVATGRLDGVKMIESSVPAAATTNKVERTTVSAGEPALRGCRILLAEDGPDNQRLILIVLRRAGAVVTVVEKGKIAVNTAMAAMLRKRESGSGNPFDVILMDMQMPVMDGYEATRLLRQKGYAGPIIAVTANAMQTDRDRCLAAGCDDYASKPIDRKKLIEVIQTRRAVAAIV